MIWLKNRRKIRYRILHLSEVRAPAGWGSTRYAAAVKAAAAKAAAAKAEAAEAAERMTRFEVYGLDLVHDEPNRIEEDLSSSTSSQDP